MGLKDTPIISVIVPIYKIENQLEKCIQSIINQTYKKLEIILVDDGSPDRCPEICDRYQKLDSRIRVIHKSNGGLVNARKTGLIAATGNLIGYVDGDDWIEPDFYEALYDAYSQTGADIVAAGFRRDIRDVSEKIFNEIPCGNYMANELEDKIIPKMICGGEYFYFGIYSYVWNKLFKRDVLYDRQLAVDERITIGEDVACTFPAILCAKSLCIIENCSYHYQQRAGSMLKSLDSIKKENERLNILDDYLKSTFSVMPHTNVIMPQVERYMNGIRLIRSDYHCDHKECYGQLIKHRSKLAIFSAGSFGQNLYSRHLAKGYYDLVGWFDRDYEQYREEGLDVLPEEAVGKVEFDKIIIASLDYRYVTSTVAYLKQHGVDESKIEYVR